MFFIGISAHLFIYLLVPALIVVYFHFRGISGNAEVNETLPVKMVYVASATPVVLKDACTFYQREIHKEKAHSQKQYLFVDKSAYGDGEYNISYHSPCVSCYSLRAPPASL